jgi:uncharacterized membrane protein
MLSPWILLNLIFSGVAFYTGALVIIAQKAQTRTDKANEEASAKHREELSNAQSALLEQNTELTKEIHEMAVKLRALTEQAAGRRARARACSHQPTYREAENDLGRPDRRVARVDGALFTRSP